MDAREPPDPGRRGRAAGLADAITILTDRATVIETGGPAMTDQTCQAPYYPLAAIWTNDCQGKQDYDGPLLRLSTRYWPGRYRADGQPSARAGIDLLYGPVATRDDRDDPNYLTLRELQVAAPTESEVKARVEAWAQDQFRALLEALGLSDEQRATVMSGRQVWS